MAARGIWCSFLNLKRLSLVQVIVLESKGSMSRMARAFTENSLVDRYGKFRPVAFMKGNASISASIGRFIHGMQVGHNKELRINQNIKAKSVRLIDQEGKNLGVMTLDSALQLGKSRDCLVVEVAKSPSGELTVCKLISEQQLHVKMKEEKKKNVKTSKTKEIKVTGKISDHDLDIKLKKIREFLEGHNSVKVFVIHRKRQNTSLEDKESVIENIAKQISDLGCLQADPKPVGNGVRAIFIPHNHKG